MRRFNLCLSSSKICHTWAKRETNDVIKLTARIKRKFFLTLRKRWPAKFCWSVSFAAIADRVLLMTTTSPLGQQPFSSLPPAAAELTATTVIPDWWLLLGCESAGDNIFDGETVSSSRFSMLLERLFFSCSCWRNSAFKWRKTGGCWASLQVPSVVLALVRFVVASTSSADCSLLLLFNDLLHKHNWKWRRQILAVINSDQRLCWPTNGQRTEQVTEKQADHSPFSILSILERWREIPRKAKFRI